MRYNAIKTVILPHPRNCGFLRAVTLKKRHYTAQVRHNKIVVLLARGVSESETKKCDE